jgi:hypothetical protein
VAFVAAAAQVLQERDAGDDHLGGAVGTRPRMGRRALLHYAIARILGRKTSCKVEDEPSAHGTGFGQMECYCRRYTVTRWSRAGKLEHPMENLRRRQRGMA